ncbi:hypothetical protein [Pectobacterium sp. CHL-2024]|uniref:hypothetical protein n=1 Tax=Pectobacterium sp. CHL-2024 TaxID=3377079 RepID=UPI0037F6D034
MFKKITYNNIMSTIGVFVSIVACFYAVKAYKATNPISFPLENPYAESLELASLSKESDQFEDFIASNVNRVVYLNVYFDSDSVDVDIQEEMDGEEYAALDKEEKDAIEYHNRTFEKESVLLWTECFDGYKKSERPSIDNHCIGFEISFQKNDQADAQLRWSRGTYYLHGYFSIIHYGGPHQGFRVATLRPEKSR